jgi:hypothetical protein
MLAAFQRSPDFIALLKVFSWKHITSMVDIVPIVFQLPVDDPPTKKYCKVVSWGVLNKKLNSLVQKCVTSTNVEKYPQ